MGTINLDGLHKVALRARHYKDNNYRCRHIEMAYKEIMTSNPRKWRVDLFKKIIKKFLNKAITLEELLKDASFIKGDLFVFLIKTYYYRKIKVDEYGNITDTYLLKVIASKNKFLPKGEKYWCQYTPNGDIKHIKKSGKIIYKEGLQLKLF